VSTEWLGKLLPSLAARGYACVHRAYGSAFDGYMGVMIAYPHDAYELVTAEIIMPANGVFKGCVLFVSLLACLCVCLCWSVFV